MNRTDAERLCNDLVKMRNGADDKQASAVVGVYPFWNENGELVQAGTRIQHDNKILKAKVDLWAIKSNSPANAPNLWEELQYRDGIRIIPQTITVTSAFSKGEKGWWEEKVYESLVNDNVYTPTAYPKNWKEVLMND